jgi:hypothetical protein
MATGGEPFQGDEDHLGPSERLGTTGDLKGGQTGERLRVPLQSIRPEDLDDLAVYFEPIPDLWIRAGRHRNLGSPLDEKRSYLLGHRRRLTGGTKEVDVDGRAQVVFMFKAVKLHHEAADQ